MQKNKNLFYIFVLPKKPKAFQEFDKILLISIVIIMVGQVLYPHWLNKYNKIFDSVTIIFSLTK